MLLGAGMGTWTCLGIRLGTEAGLGFGRESDRDDRFTIELCLLLL